MRTYLFPPVSPVSLPIIGQTTHFPVRRVYCVGQNYTAHVIEMGSDTRAAPFFFAKPTDALVPQQGGVAQIAYPPHTHNLQHEIELVIALGDGGANISIADAPSKIFAYAVGLDLTRRDLQALAKEKSQPWEMAKGFDESAPISALTPVAQCGHPKSGAIWLKLNGAQRQSGDLAQMLWSAPEIIANLSTYITLKAGDLIFTGTPAGVSTITPNDLLEGGIDGIGTLAVRIK